MELLLLAVVCLLGLLGFAGFALFAGAFLAGEGPEAGLAAARVVRADGASPDPVRTAS